MTPTEFERRVALFYECLGFDVKHDVDVGGQQVDVLAEKVVAGMDRVRLVIECKFKEDGAGAVANQQVYDFKHFIISKREECNIARGLIVTNGTFSRTAKRAAEGPLISLKTIGELENELFCLQDTYRQFAQYYESSEIFADYVPSSGEVHRAHQQIQKIDSAEDYLLRALVETDCNVFWILGDFGSGKTTLLDRMKYRTANRYLRQESQLKPILFRLRDYHRYDDLSAYVAHTVARELQRDIPKGVLSAALKNGDFLILLDGFDEMLPTADRKRRANQLLTLSPLLCSGSKSILSCRPSYFVSVEEYNEVLALVHNTERNIIPTRKDASFQSDSRRKETFVRIKRAVHEKFAEHSPYERLPTAQIATLRLSLFNEEQIKAYLRKWDAAFLTVTDEQYGWADVLAFLGGIYDLKDLMTRPILLHMIAETVAQGLLDLEDRTAILGPTSLYEIYTDAQFNRDWNKGEVRQQCLSKEQRRDFAQALALTMLVQGQTTVSWTEIKKVVAERQPVLAGLSEVMLRHTVEEIVSDIQITTFITRDENQFRFAHRSFMEYFAARYLRLRLREGRAEPLLSFNLPKEILYFLGGHAYAEPKVMEDLFRLERSGSRASGKRGKTARRNICGALIYSGTEQKAWNSENLLFVDVELRNLSLLYCTWGSALFERARLQDIEFENCTCRKIELRASEINGLSVKNGLFEAVAEGGSGTMLSVTGGSLELSLRNCSLEHVTGQSARLRVQSDGNVAEMSLSASTTTLSAGRFSRCKVVGGSLELTEQCRLDDARIRDARVVIHRGVTVNTSEFDDAQLTLYYDDSFPIQLNVCEVRRGSVYCEALAKSSHVTPLSDITFEDCIVVGLPVSVSQLAIIEREGFSMFRGCQAILLVFGARDDRAHEEEVVERGLITLVYCSPDEKGFETAEETVRDRAISMGGKIAELVKTRVREGRERLAQSKIDSRN